MIPNKSTQEDSYPSCEPDEVLREESRSLLPKAQPDQASLPWYRDVNSDGVGMIVGAVIVLNAVIIGLETDCGKTPFVIFEWFFFAFFTLELALRIEQFRLEWFFSLWNLFDGLLVVLMIADMVVLPIMNNKGGSQASVLRLIRMVRILRIIRLLKIFSLLSVILAAFIKAISIVVWVGLLTVIVIYVCAIFATQTIGHNAALWGDDAGEIENWFGSIPRSMQTLFIIMTLSEWDTMAEKLSQVAPASIVWPAFVFYILVVSYSMTSLITGCISESLISARMEDEKLRLEEIAGARDSFLQGLRQVLGHFDSDRDGMITNDELQLTLKTYPEVLDRLAALGVEINERDMLKLFARVSKQFATGAVPIDQLVDALGSLSGTAKAAALFDLKTDVADLNQLAAQSAGQTEQIRKDVANLDQKVTRISNDFDLKFDELLVIVKAMHTPDRPHRS